MTDANKIEVKEENCKCICQSKGFRNFVVVATGTFVGAFCALSLFAALHKPPMPMPCHPGFYKMRPPVMQPHHFDRHHKAPRGDFHKMKHHKQVQKPPVKMDKDSNINK